MTRRAPMSGKVGFRSDDRGPFTPDEIAELHEFVDEACRQVLEMHHLARGDRVAEAKRIDDRLAAQKREKAESEAVGPPTTQAWGEVPNDLAGKLFLNKPYRVAYKHMVADVLGARRRLLAAIAEPDTVLPEATTNGSPSPDLRQDVKGGGARYYQERVEAQRRRASRGEL